MHDHHHRAFLPLPQVGGLDDSREVAVRARDHQPSGLCPGEQCSQDQEAESQGGGTREASYDILERLSNIFGCEPFLLFEDNIQADNEIMATAFRISDLEDSDLKEIANFKDIVKSYIKMERIAQDEA